MQPLCCHRVANGHPIAFAARATVLGGAGGLLPLYFSCGEAGLQCAYGTYAAGQYQRGGAKGTKRGRAARGVGTGVGVGVGVLAVAPGAATAAAI